MRREATGANSPARQTLTWGALTLLLALSAGAIGYLSAGATTQAKPATPRLAAPAAPGLVDLVGIYRSGYSDGARAGGREARETRMRFREGGLWYRLAVDPRPACGGPPGARAVRFRRQRLLSGGGSRRRREGGREDTVRCPRAAPTGSAGVAGPSARRTEPRRSDFSGTGAAIASRAWGSSRENHRRSIRRASVSGRTGSASSCSRGTGSTTASARRRSPRSSTSSKLLVLLRARRRCSSRTLTSGLDPLTRPRGGTSRSSTRSS